MADGDYERTYAEEERNEIPLDNDYVIRRTEMKRWDRTLRDWVLIETAPASGWISASEGGPPIHATLEDPALVFGAPGDVDGLLQGEDVKEHLEAFVGQTVYDCVRVTTGGDSDYLDAKPVIVVRTATPRRG